MRFSMLCLHESCTFMAENDLQYITEHARGYVGEC